MAERRYRQQLNSVEKILTGIKKQLAPTTRTKGTRIEWRSESEEEESTTDTSGDEDEEDYSSADEKRDRRSRKRKREYLHEKKKKKKHSPPTKKAKKKKSKPAPKPKTKDSRKGTRAQHVNRKIPNTAVASVTSRMDKHIGDQNIKEIRAWNPLTGREITVKNFSNTRNRVCWDMSRKAVKEIEERDGQLDGPTTIALIRLIAQCLMKGMPASQVDPKYVPAQILAAAMVHKYEIEQTNNKEKEQTITNKQHYDMALNNTLKATLVQNYQNLAQTHSIDMSHLKGPTMEHDLVAIQPRMAEVMRLLLEHMGTYKVYAIYYANMSKTEPGSSTTNTRVYDSPDFPLAFSSLTETTGNGMSIIVPEQINDAISIMTAAISNHQQSYEGYKSGISWISSDKMEMYFMTYDIGSNKADRQTPAAFGGSKEQIKTLSLPQRDEDSIRRDMQEIMDMVYNDTSTSTSQGLTAGRWLPTPKWLAKKKCSINIQPTNSNDDQCFAWCLLRNRYPVKHHGERMGDLVEHLDEVVLPKGIEYPIRLIPANMAKIEKANPWCSFSVIWLEKGKRSYTPFHSTANRKTCHALLGVYQQNGYAHFILITNGTRFARQRGDGHKQVLCERCLTMHYLAGIQKHEYDCKRNFPTRVVVPKDGGRDHVVSFRQWKARMKRPFVIYADFEAILKPIANNEDGLLRPDEFAKLQHRKVQNTHETSGFAYKIECSHPHLYALVGWRDMPFNKMRFYVGPNAINKFYKAILCDTAVMQNYVATTYHPYRKNPVEAAAFRKATHCHICERPFEDPQYPHKLKQQRQLRWSTEQKKRITRELAAREKLNKAGDVEADDLVSELHIDEWEKDQDMPEVRFCDGGPEDDQGKIYIDVDEEEEEPDSGEDEPWDSEDEEEEGGAAFADIRMPKEGNCMAAMDKVLDHDHFTGAYRGEFTWDAKHHTNNSAYTCFFARMGLFRRL